MKKLIKTALFVLFTTLSTQGFAQQATNVQHDSTFVSTTFSVEINAGTTLNDLKKIEEMLLNDYKIKVLFENVRIEEDKIVALRMQLVNGSQSFMKSIDNYNVPIQAFKINLTESKPGLYTASITNLKDSNSRNKLSTITDFNESIPEIESEMIDLNTHFDAFFKEFEASREKMQQLFEKFQNETEHKKELSKTKTKNENRLKSS